MTDYLSSARRRLVITVCPRETGTVTLAVERGQRRRRLDARGILQELQGLIDSRGLGAFVSVREGCAGGCYNTGPNVSLTLHALSPPGRRPDNIAIGWESYVGSIGALDCLATILETHLGAFEEVGRSGSSPEHRPRARSRPRDSRA